MGIAGIPGGTPRVTPYVETMLDLPLELTSFVGREGEVQELVRLLDSATLVTLIGPPGVGKSRLAARAAARFAVQFDQRALLIDLADTNGQARIRLPAVAGPFVLILDNCDHALASCTELLPSMLAAFPRLTLMATCREPLGLIGEVVWRVKPLPAPSESNDVDEIATVASVSLFADRARDVLPDFALTWANVPTVGRICRELDGLPLAIELAAERIGILDLASLATRLDLATRLMPVPNRTYGREHALGASIEWGLAALDADEQQLLWDLSIFKSSWTLSAAEAVCADGRHDSLRITYLISRLVSLSLVEKSDQSRGAEVRYQLLNVIRRYASRRLDGDQHTRLLRRRHASWYRHVAESIALGSGTDEGIERLRQEEPNLVAALEWAVEAVDTDTALSLATCLHGLWYISGRFGESRPRATWGSTGRSGHGNELGQQPRDGTG
jgi:predicted ATPase